MYNNWPKKGFTLIELLVVIAIVALLISIITPALRRAKELSTWLVCGSNARQLTAAWILYADENDNNLVGASVDYAYAWVGATPEDGTLWPYIESWDCYKCPAGIEGFDITYSISDSMNAELTGDSSLLQFKNKKRSDIKMPSERMVFIDEGRSSTACGYTQNNDQLNWWDPVPCRHGEGTALSMADGHTELWRWRDERSATWDYEQWSISSSVRNQPDNVDMIKMQRSMWWEFK